MTLPTKGARISRSWGFVRSLIVYLNPITLSAWRRFYRELLAPNDVVIDVGAHVGTRVRAMHAVGAQVIALEPQEPFASFLRRTLPSDVVFIDAAAGASETSGDMAVSLRHPTVSTLRTDFVTDAATFAGYEQVTWNETQRVRVVTLNSVIATYGTPRDIRMA